MKNRALVPLSCLLLPHNNSSFNPLIISPAVCAIVKMAKTSQPTQSKSDSLMHSREFRGHFHLSHIGMSHESMQRKGKGNGTAMRIDAQNNKKRSHADMILTNK